MFVRFGRPSHATVVAYAALFIALGGVSYAALKLPGNSVGSKQIKRGAVKAADLGKNAVTSGKVKDGSLLAADFALGQLPAGGPGATGPQGPAGEPGAKGDTGPRGPSDGFTTRIAASKTVNSLDDSREIISGQLNSGTYLLMAKFVVENLHGVDNSKPVCELGIMSGETFVVKDRVNITLGTDDDTEEQVTTLLGSAVVPADNTPYLVRCEPTGETYILTFRERSLAAIEVANLTAVG